MIEDGCDDVDILKVKGLVVSMAVTQKVRVMVLL